MKECIQSTLYSSPRRTTMNNTPWPLLLLLVALSFFPNEIQADYKDWSDENKAQYKTFLTLQLIDTAETWTAINCQKHTLCSIKELNPILGSHPSKGELIALKLIGNYGLYKLIDKRLDDDERKRSLRILNGVFTVVVMNNGIQLVKQF